jgi:hypothetical protein
VTSSETLRHVRRMLSGWCAVPSLFFVLSCCVGGGVTAYWKISFLSSEGRRAKSGLYICRCTSPCHTLSLLGCCCSG